MSTPKTTLALLCGGQAIRLGTDKGLFRPLGDESFVVRALRLLGEGFSEVLIVVRDREQAELYQQELTQVLPVAERAVIRIVTDNDRFGNHPRAALTGVATALAATTTDAVIAIPVDQVGVRAIHIQRLQRQYQTAATASAFSDAQGEPLAFPSLWPRSQSEQVQALITAGSLSVKNALTTLHTHLLDAGDAALALEANINTQAEAREYFGEPLFDPFNRRLHYLRFSLTEACNLSCTYCLPEGFPEWYRHKARLDQNEIDVILRGFRRLGFRKVRLTGGEPTVHPHSLETVRLARDLGYERIAMTTNGLLIKDLKSWIDAGLNQLNISLDALDDQRFYAVTKSHAVETVKALVEEAAQYAPALTVKVNTVLLRTKNGDQQNIENMIDWALGLPISLRFIELMDTKLNSTFASTERVLGSEIEPLLRARGLSRDDEWQESDKAPPHMHGIRPIDLKGPATDYRSSERPGSIGLINPLSCNFCSKCNRLRITAKGRLKLCLFGDDDIPLDLSTPEAVALNVRHVIGRKPERHYLEAGNVGNVATFRTIGG